MQFLSFRRLLRRKPQGGDVVMVKGGGPLRLRAIDGNAIGQRVEGNTLDYVSGSRSDNAEPIFWRDGGATTHGFRGAVLDADIIGEDGQRRPKID